MIKLENCDVMGWEHAMRGMRNPMNSWDRSDSEFQPCAFGNPAKLGPEDLKLMKNLRKAGTDHRKFMRMIAVYVDITAPLYWWKEFDTYKVGTVANSCSTMHKIAEKELTLDDFSCEHLTGFNKQYVLQPYIDTINTARRRYVDSKNTNKEEWWQIIQLLPSSYNQKRTVMLNYEVLANIYKSRKNHKLDEWVGLCKWIEKLPCSEIITGEEKGE